MYGNPKCKNPNLIGETIETVNKLFYLGMIKDNKGVTDLDIIQQINKARNVLGLLNNICKPQILSNNSIIAILFQERGIWRH